LINTTDIGTYTESKVLSALLKQGKRVLIPFGGGARYDIVVDDNNKFIRIQCKTARLREGCLLFNSRSDGRNGKVYPYQGDADFFGVYSPDTDKVYLVPISIIPNGHGTLRIDRPGSAHPNIKYAEDYIIR
jgi:hypothetical protein